MDGIREICIAYYDRETKGEKDLVEQYFKRFDTKGNRKITLQQYRSAMFGEHLSGDKIFRKLDANKDGTLDFDDIMCLYYMDKKLGLQKCAKCGDLLAGAYFSCSRCVQDGLDSECRLCCSCYHLGDFKHDHTLGNFLDQHSMVKFLKKHTPDARQDWRRKELEELQEIAKSYYKAGTQEIQDLAKIFFDSMDVDRDGKVDLTEFLEFMKEEGYTRMQNRKFFRELDIDGNGTLDFDEVMTAYYICKSGRPFCDGECKNFIRGIYFSCVVCYRNPKESFTLCCDCYRSKKCDHKHDGRAQFVDNFALLEAMKVSGPKESDGQNQATNLTIPSNTQPKGVVPPANGIPPTIPSKTEPKGMVPRAETSPAPSKTQARSPVPAHTTTVPAATNTCIVFNTTLNVVNPPPPAAAYHNAVIPRPQRLRLAFKALEVALPVALGLANVFCTIM